MKLYTICPNPYNNYQNYKPEEGIKLSFVENVPCLDPLFYNLVAIKGDQCCG